MRETAEIINVGYTTHKEKKIQITYKYDNGYVSTNVLDQEAYDSIFGDIDPKLTNGSDVILDDGYIVEFIKQNRL